MPIIRESHDSRPKQNTTNGNSPNSPKHSRENSAETSLRYFDEYETTYLGQQMGSGPAERPESRQELIARIKRDQRPIWLQNATDLSDRTATSPSQTPTLLPPAELSSNGAGTEEPRPTPLELASNIERPKSALHAGDFHEQQNHDCTRQNLFNFQQQDSTGWISTSPTDPWFTPSHSLPRHSPLYENSDPLASHPMHPLTRSRAASQSILSSSFIMRPPTSPLAHASETNDLEDRTTERTRSRSPTKTSRRHTFSPRSLRATQHSSPNQHMSFAFGRPLSTLRREETEPYPTRDKRRSFVSLTNVQHHSSPQTPTSRSRRPSLLSDGSPLQAPLVGGYEESILRGRMSTLPSRPLDFVAQIGVLGKGDCKRSLRCPPHISIPFPAVYYNYGNSREGTSTSDSPSPYVGLIDMEGFSREREQQLQTENRRPETPGSDADINADEKDINPMSSEFEPNKIQHKHRYRLSGSTASRRAPKGGYRIPQQGQLQIIIKNPNKTAVKLFLIPFDLTGMEAGQKTFIRQRSYSAGPIIDMPLSARTNLGTDRPEAALSNSTDPKDRPVLRYLIHLHICCPSRGRYYLYNSIRVVFANRVPDGKEKLRNEIQLPEPRYSAFRPTTDAQLSQKVESRASSSHHQLMMADQGPPSLPNTQTNTDYDFSFSYSDEGSHLAGQPHGTRRMSFQRKKLPAFAPEISPNGSGSSNKSDPMHVDSPPEALPAKSNHSPMASEHSFAAPTFDRPGVNGSHKHISQSAQNGSREQSPSNRSGLLSLQLRDLARNGTSTHDV